MPKPAAANTSPDPASPPWRAVGTEIGKGGETHYLFEVDGQPLRIRQAMLSGVGAVMSLDPNAARWRAMFPNPVSRARLDVPAIVGFLMQECRAAQRRADAAKAAADPAAAPPETTR